MNFFILLLVLSSTIFASVGQIASLKGSCIVTRADKTLDATVGFKVEEKDILKTQDKAKAQIMFEDGTIVTIGKSSTFNISDYIYDTKSNTSKVNFAFLEGSFKSITGKIGKIAPQKFNLRTKTATIGIRGTIIVGNQNRIACTSGIITVSSHKVTQIVPAGMFSNTPPNAPPTTPQIYKLGDIGSEDIEQSTTEETEETGNDNQENSTQTQNNEQTEETPAIQGEDYGDTDVSNPTSTNVGTSQTTNALNVIPSITEESQQIIINILAVSVSTSSSISSESSTSTSSSISSVSSASTSSSISSVSSASTSSSISSVSSASTSSSTSSVSSASTSSSTSSVSSSTGNDTEEAVAKTQETVISSSTVLEITEIDTTGLTKVEKTDELEKPYLEYGYWELEQVPEYAYLSGVVTSSDFVDEMINKGGTASYSGGLSAIVTKPDGSVIGSDGSVKMDFDFTQQSFSGKVNVTEGGFNANVAGNTHKYGFDATSVTKDAQSVANITSGSLSGDFYGPSAEAVGGNFSLNSSNNGNAHGVFGAVK